MRTSRFDPFLSDSPCANVRPDSNKSAFAYNFGCWNSLGKNSKILLKKQYCYIPQQKQNSVSVIPSHYHLRVSMSSMPDMYHTHHYPNEENTEQSGKSYNIPAFISPKLPSCGWNNIFWNQEIGIPHGTHV